MASTEKMSMVFEQQPSRQKLIQSLVSTMSQYNEILKGLRDEKNHINGLREKLEISFQIYWNLRVDLECRIQDIIEHRENISRELVLAVSGRA